jgi:hypothetical protein
MKYTHNAVGVQGSRPRFTGGEVPVGQASRPGSRISAPVMMMHKQRPADPKK